MPSNAGASSSRRCRLFVLTMAFAVALLAAVGAGCGWFFTGPHLSEEAVKNAKNYHNGVFENPEPTTVMKPGTYWRTFSQFLFQGSNERVPKRPLPVVSAKNSVLGPVSTSPRFIWLGHSGVLLELGGKRILIDPVLSERASFFSWIGPKRFEPAPLHTEDLPAIDAVLISHDHYDHLDKATIIALAGKTASFHVPLGIGAILKAWGIAGNKIVEYAWWEGHSVNGLTLTAVPARHFSGRGLFDRDKTLWCSWVIGAGNERVYHSGDTGMTAQFKVIGEKYGPFDLAFIKIGAFNENWPDVHLTPEQAVEAAQILGVKTLVPIHWGTFNLGLHSWHEPIERFVKAAEKTNSRILTPKIGDYVDPENYENTLWWQDLVDAGENTE